MEKQFCLKEKSRKRMRKHRSSLINKVYWCIRYYSRMGVHKISPVMVVGYIHSLTSDARIDCSAEQVTRAFNKLGREGLVKKVEMNGCACFDLWINTIDN